jgi:hypothetical protein
MDEPYLSFQAKTYYMRTPPKEKPLIIKRDDKSSILMQKTICDTSPRQTHDCLRPSVLSTAVPGPRACELPYTDAEHMAGAA